MTRPPSYPPGAAPTTAPPSDAAGGAADVGVRALGDDLPRADAIVAAVAHREFKVRSIDDIVAKVAADGLYVDVKCQADAAVLRSRGLVVWRL